jgi:hypothetical protein
MHSTDKKLIKSLAARFATTMWWEVGTRSLIAIDTKNRTAAPGVCASHDFTDANMVMNEVFVTSALGDMAKMPLNTDLIELWARVWNYTKAVGFCRLRGIRGLAESGYQDVGAKIEQVDDELRITQPTHSEPVIVAADYWGHNPRLQVMIYEADGSGEPALKVRFTPEGKIREVVCCQLGAGVLVIMDDRHDTPWSNERDGNPACRKGDLLLMPSGQYGEVMRLRERYDNYEDYVRCDTIYQVAKRLHESRTGEQVRGMLDGVIVKALWRENPLTASTTDTTDMFIVPEDTTELPDPELILNYKQTIA